MSIKNLGPLDWRTPIVTKDGAPTPEFQRRWAIQTSNNSQIPTLGFGTGAPTGTPTTSFYFDTSTTPFTFYIAGLDGAWHKAGVTRFTELSDVPSSYTAKGTYLVRVNAGATGLEFVTQSQELDTIGSTRGSILERGASGWQAITPGAANTLLVSGGAAADPTWTAFSALIDAAIGSTRGALLERGASGWALLTPGTSGFLLQSAGAGADPLWAAAPTGLTAIANNNLLANTSGSSAIPVATTLTALIDAAIGSTRGAILYRGASGWAILGPGTSGFALVSNGAGADPTYQAVGAGAGGAMTLIGSVVMGGSTRIATFSSIPGTYKHLKAYLVGRSTLAGTGTDTIFMTFNGDTNANYWWQSIFGIGGTAGAGAGSGAGQNTFIRSAEITTAGDLANEPASSEIDIIGYAGTTYYKQAHYHYTVNNANSSSNLVVQIGGGTWRNTSAITQVDFAGSTNWAGRVDLYGIS